jgi:hypothetical protein
MANRNSTAPNKRAAPDYRAAIRRVMQLAPAEENDLIKELSNVGSAAARVAQSSASDRHTWPVIWRVVAPSAGSYDRDMVFIETPDEHKAEGARQADT